MELDHMIWRMYLTRAHNIAMPKCCRARKLDLDYVAVHMTTQLFWNFYQGCRNGLMARNLPSYWNNSSLNLIIISLFCLSSSELTFPRHTAFPGMFRECHCVQNYVQIPASGSTTTTTSTVLKYRHFETTFCCQTDMNATWPLANGQYFRTRTPTLRSGPNPTRSPAFEIPATSPVHRPRI